MSGRGEVFVAIPFAALTLSGAHAALRIGDGARGGGEGGGGAGEAAWWWAGVVPRGRGRRGCGVPGCTVQCAKKQKSTPKIDCILVSKVSFK